MILNANSIAQLNRALENSFGNIKKDMTELKVLLNTQNEKYSDIRREVENVKNDSATKDKINVLKIKIGEVNEDAKKIWDVEKQLKVLNQPPKKAFQESLDELNAKLVATELKLNQEVKTSASETQLKNVVAGINKELNVLAQEIRNVEFKKDVLSNEVVKSFENKIGSKFRQNNEALNDLRKDLKSYVDKNELKNVVSEFNNDFDLVKREVNNNFDHVKKELIAIQKDAKSFVKETEIKGVLNKINNEFDLVSKELTGLKSQNKDFVTVKQIKGLIDDISDEFDEIKSDLGQLKNVKMAADKLGQFKKEVSSRKDVDELRKSFSQLQKEVKNTASRSDVEEILGKNNYGASVVLRDYSSAKKVPVKPALKPLVKNEKPFRKTYAFGNFLITIAFLSLIASIGSYYFATEALMNNFAIGAVASFVVGMALRMIAVSKGR